MPDCRTLAEVALDLKVKEPWLRKLVRDAAIPVLRHGRVVRFDELATRALEEALRSPSKSSAGQTPARSPSPARSRASASAAARRATILLSPAKRQRSSRQQSCAPSGTANVVALAPSLRRS
jgi:hypothetical protein